jgi:beta-glucosidase
LKKDFLWGTATASYQCEGAWNEDGRVLSLWDKYLHENNFENGDIASDHYHRFKEDIHFMKEGGHNSYRFSLSWPRLITDLNGTVNPKGVQFYHELIDELLRNGIQPHVTIFHWDLPQYLEDIGGWLNRETITHYERLAKLCFKEYGNKVKYWTTFNEPRFYVFNGYKIGNYPPGLNDTQKTINASFNIMLANARTVGLYHELKLPGSIGIVHSYSPVFGIDKSVRTKIAMRYADNFYNNWVLDTAARGEIPVDLLGRLEHDGYDLSVIEDGDLEIIKKNTVDFIGLNYYARVLIKPYTTGETTLRVNNKGKAGKGTSRFIVKDWFEVAEDPDTIKTEWDTEIYPKGLYAGILMAWKRYRLPIFITENGVGYYEDVSVEKVQDNYRIEFLNDHIDAIKQAVEKGADVRGYYVWSTMDLYSWKNGKEKRYGLVAVDWDDNLKRKPKKSYDWFKKVCVSNGESVERRKKYD